VNFIDSNGMAGLRNVIESHSVDMKDCRVFTTWLNHGEHQAKSLGGWHRLHRVLAKGVGTRSTRRCQSWSNTAP
jgi:hypothetical protein